VMPPEIQNQKNVLPAAAKIVPGQSENRLSR
jgi:hypothetical protein